MLQSLAPTTRNFERGDLRTRDLGRALDYWERLSAGCRRLPARGELDPVEMHAFLPHVLLVDVIRDTARRVADFRFRLTGAEVAARHGRDLSGISLMDVGLDGRGDAVLAAFLQTVAWGAPQYFVDAATCGQGRPTHCERLLMPLSADGAEVDVVFGVEKALIAA